MKKIKLLAISLFFLMILSACVRTTTNITIEFETNGGSIIESITTNREYVVLPTNPTKDGYVFDGWYFDNETFSVPFVSSELLNQSSNDYVVLYAKWIIQDDDLTLQLKSIYELAIETEVFTGTYEEWLETVRGPEGAPGADGREIRLDYYDGYIRWQYVGSNEWTNLIHLSDLQGNGGLSAYEIYLLYHPEYTSSEEVWIDDLVNGKLAEKQTYEIVLDFNDGVTPNQVIYVDHLDQIILPDDPIRENYEFVGWFIEDLQVNFLYYFAHENVTLTAHWRPVIAPTEIVFFGADSIEIDYGSEFNVLDGVVAIGNNDIDYTDYITYYNLSETEIIRDTIDTTIIGHHIIKYEVQFEGFITQKYRTITVSDPLATDGQMLVNPDFSQGTTGWDGSANYIADGAEMTLFTEEFDGNPALKVEVVAGSNVWTPRFGQMNVPFEQGVTYEVSFKAKSTANKTISLWAGELLNTAPWYYDFLEGTTIYKNITTEWATYSYKFTMNDDNQRGGLLFNLGAIDSIGVDATLWFDDISIVETTPDLDVTAPTFSGLTTSKTILKGSIFDPLSGVTAFDEIDGDVTDDIVVEIKDINGDVVSALDTSVETKYTITYIVSDTSGNERQFVATILIDINLSDTNLIANPSFLYDLDSTNPEWSVWHQDWNDMPVVTNGIDTASGVYTIDISGGGDAAWAVQLSQDGYITLEEGVTYRLAVTVSAEVARKMNIALGIPYSTDPFWDEYARFDGVDIGETETTLEFLFTVTRPTDQVKLVFELGTQVGFADGTITFNEVKLQEVLMDDIITNSTMDDGWTLWHQYWGDAPTVTYDRTGGMFNITTDKSGEANWAIQFNQELDLKTNTTYILTFEAKASVTRDISVKLFAPDVWVMHIDITSQMLTTNMDTYSYEFTTGDSYTTDLIFSFELGLTYNFAAGTVSFDNISLKEKNVADASEIIVNGDATTVPYFMYDDAGEGVSTMVLGAAGGAIIDVTTLGRYSYQPHVYQMLDGLEAGKYVLKVVVTSSVDRDLRVNMIVPLWGYASILATGKYDFDVIADVQKTIYIEFTVTNDIIDDVKFEFDFGNLGDGFTSEPGTFTIHEVFIYQKIN